MSAAQIRARFAGLAAEAAADEGTEEAPDESDCGDVVAALDLVRDGTRELQGRRIGGRSRAENMALCRALPAEVRACLAPAHHAAHVEDCRAALGRFASNRDDPAWLERLSGHPASERPEPSITEAQARAMNARRSSRRTRREPYEQPAPPLPVQVEQSDGLVE